MMTTAADSPLPNESSDRARWMDLAEALRAMAKSIAADAERRDMPILLDRAATLADACTAALAAEDDPPAASGPDAGTEEREDDGPEGYCEAEPNGFATAPASGAAPEERDGDLDRLLRNFGRICEDRMTMTAQKQLDAIHAHVAQRERAAREEGRAEMVLADDEMVERVAKAMHNRVEAPHAIFWQSWETQTEFNRQCARRWVKDVLTVAQSVLREAPDAHP